MRDGPELAWMAVAASDIADENRFEPGEHLDSARTAFAALAGNLQLDPRAFAEWMDFDRMSITERWSAIAYYLYGRGHASGFICEHCNRPKQTPGLRCVCQEFKEENTHDGNQRTEET